ncbi:hypothetical protein V8E54_005061 [Elaphomyces granulatus]|jgi:hypothetical protein
MAQVIEILHGGLEVPASLSSFLDTNDPRKEVGWYNDIIHRMVVEFGVIELFSSVPKDIEENLLNGENHLNMRRTILRYEATANNGAAGYAELYGYHPIFRAGLCKCYMT